VQGVEEKVRIELRPERLELGACTQRLGAGRAGLLLAQPAGRLHRVADPRDGAVHHHPREHLPGKRVAGQVRGGELAP
jgi:hypothetical protein